MTRPLAFISLFSGIGGFDLGFERAGMTCVAQVEWDKKAQQVLARHWPEVPRFKDVKDVGRSSLPAADVLCGGFPCQDVSVAGRRAGLAGERSGLWFEFHRIIGELHPRAVVIENVPGLLSSNGGRDFAVILQGLVEHGYRVTWRVLDAQYFGLAQRRKRLFIVGSLGDGRSAEILLERQSVRGSAAEGGEAWESAAGDVGQSTENQLVGTLSASGSGTQRPGGQGAEWDMYVCDLQQITSVANRSVPQEIAPTLASASDVITFARQRTDKYRADTVDATVSARDGKSATDLVVFASNQREEVRDLNNLAVALQAEPGSHQQTFLSLPSGVRRLTPTECERLQGFPDQWTGEQADTVRYRQLGNAVAVPVAEWIGRRIVEVLA